MNLSPELQALIIDKLKIQVVYRRGVKSHTKVFMTKVPNKVFDELFEWFNTCASGVITSSFKMDICYQSRMAIYGLFPKCVDKLNNRVVFSHDYYEEP